MGIGDKQRIEAERREKYAEAIHGTRQFRSAVDAVIELVDAEVEALQEQIERDGERIAALIGDKTRLKTEEAQWQDAYMRLDGSHKSLLDRVTKAEALLESLPREIMKNAETRGDLSMAVAKACADHVRYLIDGYRIERDRGVKEPEYEYTHIEVGGHVASPRWDTAEAATRALQVYTYPEHWRVVRRPKPQDWEDVQ